MKITSHLSILVLASCSGLALADSTTSMSPADAKATWDSLSPDQQAALMQKAKNEGYVKQEAWQSLTPEEQAAKKSSAKSSATEKASPYQESWQNLTPEEQAAKKSSAKSSATEMASPYVNSMKSEMSTKRSFRRR